MAGVKFQVIKCGKHELSEGTRQQWGGLCEYLCVPQQRERQRLAKHREGEKSLGLPRGRGMAKGSSVNSPSRLLHCVWHTCQGLFIHVSGPSIARLLRANSPNQTLPLSGRLQNPNHGLWEEMSKDSHEAPQFTEQLRMHPFGFYSQLPHREYCHLCFTDENKTPRKGGLSPSRRCPVASRDWSAQTPGPSRETSEEKVLAPLPTSHSPLSFPQ